MRSSTFLCGTCGFIIMHHIQRLSLSRTKYWIYVVTYGVSIINSSRMKKLRSDILVLGSMQLANAVEHLQDYGKCQNGLSIFHSSEYNFPQGNYLWRSSDIYDTLWSIDTHSCTIFAPHYDTVYTRPYIPVYHQFIYTKKKNRTIIQQLLNCARSG